MAIKIDGVKIAGLSNDPKSVYQIAREGGYAGTEQEFNAILATTASVDYVDEQIEENKITKVSELTNDSGYLTSYTETDPTVPSWAKASSKPTYTYSEVGAAASSHNHAATNITSGTLPVARGGTGLTAAPSMLTNLASTTAASVFAASPRPGVTGTLPVANGGTGVTSIASLKSALGITSGGANFIGANSTSECYAASGDTTDANITASWTVQGGSGSGLSGTTYTVPSGVTKIQVIVGGYGAKTGSTVHAYCKINKNGTAVYTGDVLGDSSGNENFYQHIWGGTVTTGDKITITGEATYRSSYYAYYCFRHLLILAG